jgi:uncharacterized protein (TIGR02145 family)
VIIYAALPGGNRNTSGSFNNQSNNANYWSSSESGGNAWNRNLNYNNPKVNRNDNRKSNGFSVRCVQELIHDDLIVDFYNLSIRFFVTLL